MEIEDSEEWTTREQIESKEEKENSKIDTKTANIYAYFDLSGRPIWFIIEILLVVVMIGSAKVLTNYT